MALNNIKEMLEKYRIEMMKNLCSYSNHIAEKFVDYIKETCVTDDGEFIKYATRPDKEAWEEGMNGFIKDGMDIFHEVLEDAKKELKTGKFNSLYLGEPRQERNAYGSIGSPASSNGKASCRGVPKAVVKPPPASMPPPTQSIVSQPAEKQTQRPDQTRIQEEIDDDGVVVQPVQPTTDKFKCSWMCDIPACRRHFGDKNQLINHRVEDHKIKEHRCLIKNCEESFPDKHDLSNHIKRKHEGMNSIACRAPGCNKFFIEDHFEMFKHYEERHECVYICGRRGCTFKSNDKGEAKTHYENRHGNDSPTGLPLVHVVPFRSSVQLPMTPTPANRSNSALKKMNAAQKNPKKRSYTKREWNYSENKVQNKEKKKIKCKFCNKKFPNRVIQKKHMYILHKKPMTLCSYREKPEFPKCGFMTMYKSSAITHVRAVHYKEPITKKKRIEAGIVETGREMGWLSVAIYNGSKAAMVE